MSEERRKQARFDSLNLAYLCEDEEGAVTHEGMGRTLNVSEGGILLETNFAVGENSTIMLLIALEDELLTVRGRVAHSREDGPETFRTGVEFFGMEEEGKNILRQFIRFFSEEQGAS